MRRRAKKTRWAFDTSPDDGVLPGPVYAGNREDWDPSETRKRRWTTPITPGATKAVHGTPTFDSARYRCCHDLENCGVRVKVRQGDENAWHFAREWDYGFRHAPQHLCINKQQYTGESRFHLMTKLNIERILKTEAWKEFYNIKEVYLERFVQNIQDIKPDVHYTTNDNQTIIIEVVVTNAPNRYKHEQFGPNMAIINLKELGVTMNDSDFDKWVKSGGIERVLQEELALERRAVLSAQRDQHFEQVDQAEWERDMREVESKCRDLFGFTLKNFNRTHHDFSTPNEMERAFQEEHERRVQEEEYQEEYEEFLETMKKENVELAVKYGEDLEPDFDDFEMSVVNGPVKLRAFYEDKLFEKRIELEKKEKEEKEIQRKKDLKRAQEKENQLVDARASWKENDRNHRLRYLKMKIEEHLEKYGEGTDINEQNFDTYGEIDRFFESKTKNKMTIQAKQSKLMKEFKELVNHLNVIHGFRSILIENYKVSVLELLVVDDDIMREIYEEEKGLRDDFDQWHRELEEEYLFSLAGTGEFEKVPWRGPERQTKGKLKSKYEQALEYRRRELTDIIFWYKGKNPELEDNLDEIDVNEYIQGDWVEGLAKLRAEAKRLGCK